MSVATAPETSALPPVVLPDSRAMPRKRWTRDDVRRMLTSGLLEGDRRYELIEGEIIEKAGQGRRHIIICMRIIKILAQVFGFDYLQSQSTLALSLFNEPEPDTAVLDKAVDEYVDENPGPQNVRFMVEVSDTTLDTDRRVKAMIYARAGIVEYRIVNIPERTLEVFRQPTPDGYTLSMILSDQETVRPVTMPTAEVRVADIFLSLT